MFHACPEIHCHRPHLNFYRIIIHTIDMINRNSYDDMQAPVAIFLLLPDIILLLLDQNVCLLFDSFLHMMDRIILVFTPVIVIQAAQLFIFHTYLIWLVCKPYYSSLISSSLTEATCSCVRPKSISL